MRKTHERMKEFGLLSSDMTCLSWDESWELPRDKVVVNRKLGEGAFGTVLGGEANLEGQGWVAVAVKALKIGARVDEKVTITCIFRLFYFKSNFYYFHHFDEVLLKSFKKIVLLLYLLQMKFGGI